MFIMRVLKSTDENLHLLSVFVCTVFIKYQKHVTYLLIKYIIKSITQDPAAKETLKAKRNAKVNDF